MPLPILAASAFPILTALAKELWVGALAISSVLIFFYKLYLDKQEAKRKREAEETDKIRQAAYARIEKLESSVKNFIDKEKLDERFSQLSKQVGDNQGAIKTTHDRGEEVANKLDMRVTALENNHSQLAGLPAQVQKLNTDHAILSSKVDAITTNLDKIERKQDENFRLLFEAVKDIARTQGQIDK